MTGPASRRGVYQVQQAGEPLRRQLDVAQIALMLKSGTEFLANGNIGAARMMLQPAAEAGDPTAAFALAETYDPAVLGKWGVKGGISPDIAQARKWYARSKDLGSTKAPERLVEVGK
jgi:TPR repeat protein